MSNIPVPTEENPYRDVKYIADITQFKAATIRGWLRSGRMKGFTVAGEWRVLHSDFVDFLQKEFGDDV